MCIVGGCGHVGLPLALSFAQQGLRVGLFDTDEAAVRLVQQGTMPFMERGADDLLTDMVRAGRITTALTPELVRAAPIVVIVIGTPIDEFLNPTLTALGACVRTVAPHIQDDALVVLRSTVYPGTTEWLANAIEAEGRRADVVFCPERIAEGNALEELRALPQIVGSDNERAGDRAEALFRRLAAEIIRTSTREAEITKLFTNAWRYMKFAIANQFLMIAQEAGLDYSRVLHAIRHQYPRAADLPGPGLAAGPCLLKDTMQLAAYTQNHFMLGHAAMLVNEGLPAFIVERLARRRALDGLTIGILGMAFKAESDDIRASLSFKLRKLLTYRGAEVLCTDPYVRSDGLVPLDEVLLRSDVLVIGAPHRIYQSLDLQDRDVVDVWGGVRGGISL